MRASPICFLFNLDVCQWVPVIEINDSGYIVWDDGQWSRDYEPEPCYEISPSDEFDLERGKYTKTS